MKPLIFLTKFPTNDIIVYTPNMEILGKIEYCKELEKFVWNQTNNKFLTFKRLNELLLYCKRTKLKGCNTWE